MWPITDMLSAAPSRATAAALQPFDEAELDACFGALQIPPAVPELEPPDDAALDAVFAALAA